MRYEIETSDYTGENMFKTSYDDSDTYTNTLLERESVFLYVRDLMNINVHFINKRQFIKVDNEIIWTRENGFNESWLKKELEYTLRN